MALITWSDDLSVGVEGIDDQHKKLVQLVNGLHNHLGDFLKSSSRQTGRMRMSHLGKSGLRSSRASTSRMASFDREIPFW